MLDVCYMCGEIVTRSSHILICIRCAADAPITGTAPGKS